MPRRLALSMMTIAAASLLVLPGCRGFLTYRIAEAPMEEESRHASVEIRQQRTEAETPAPTNVASRPATVSRADDS